MQARDDDGIERISWMCFAPLCLQLNLFVGKGILIRVPLRIGLQDMTLILRA